MQSQQNQNEMQETINEELESKKESRWDRIKKSLKFIPIFATSIGFGIATAVSMGIVPGMIVATGLGLGMSTGALKTKTTTNIKGLTVDSSRNKLLDRISDIFAEECDNPLFYDRDHLSEVLTKDDLFLKYYIFGENLAIKEEILHVLKLQEYISKLTVNDRPKGAWRGYTVDALNNIKQRALEELHSFMDGYLSDDVKKLASRFESRILNDPRISLDEKYMYFEILMDIEILISHDDTQNQIRSKNAFFANEFNKDNNFLDEACIDLWGRSYNELLVVHGQRARLTTPELRNSLRNAVMFDNTPINYGDIENTLIAISDSIKVVERELDAGNLVEIDEYDIAYLTLGQHAHNKRGNNLVHLLAEHFSGKKRIASDLIQLGLKDHDQVVDFIFDIISSEIGIQHGFDSENQLQVAYKLQVDGEIKYLCIGFNENGDKSIFTAFVADNDLTKKINNLNVINEIDAYNV